VISVIAPCLNEEKHLPSFLDSLTGQSLEPTWFWDGFELIVVDGGSRDRSRSIIDSFDDRLHIVKLIDETRNLGFVRNRGARAARGEILFFTNTDAWLPSFLLPVIHLRMSTDNRLQALSGRTVPWNGGALCSAAHHAFDLLRWGFSKLGKFSPSGNFLAVKSEAFQAVGGFSEKVVNEDGDLGARLISQGKCQFNLDLWAGHYAKRWRNGGLKTLLFYSYVFGNFSPVLKRILSSVELRSSREFNRK